MRRRTAAVLAWGAWGVFALLAVSAVVLSIMVSRVARSPTEVLSAREVVGTAMFMVAFFATGTVGRLIASRQPRNAIGWIMLGVALCAAVLFGAQQYATLAFELRAGTLPAGRWAVWLSNWIWIVPIAVPLTLLVLLFPDGRLPSRRWRPFAWFAGGFLALTTLIFALAGGNLVGVRVVDPVGIKALQPVAIFLDGAGFLVFVVLMLLSTVALVRRYRTADGVQRRQIKWFVWAASLAVTVFLAQAALDALGLRGTLLGAALPALSFLLIPVGIGIAILRHRLYDIDVVIRKSVVIAVPIGFITLVYLVVVLGIPTLVFGASGERQPGALAPFAAAAILALAFQPVRQWGRRLADRLVYGERATPYEVLSQFAERAGATYSMDDVLPRMARLVVESTAATECQVWLRLGDELVLETQWPAERDAGAVSRIPLAGDELPVIPAVDRSISVRHRGELLGGLTLRVSRAEPLTPAQEKLLEDVASQAGLVLRNVRLIEELRASRQRLVAAQDEERRRLERNIHDGAQQQLVALAVNLRLARSLAEEDPAKAGEILERLEGEAQQALDDLRDLARGIYPPLLADKGLTAALEAQARKSAIPVEVHRNGVGRYPPETEAAVYFCVLEALQNAAKYAGASRVEVRLEAADGELRFEVNDDGRGFDPATTTPGTGLQNMRDRLETLGGEFAVVSGPGQGTTVAGRVPVQQAQVIG